VTANIRAPVCQLIGYVLICFRWVRRCRGARRCRSTARHQIRTLPTDSRAGQDWGGTL